MTVQAIQVQILPAQVDDLVLAETQVDAATQHQRGGDAAAVLRRHQHGDVHLAGFPPGCLVLCLTQGLDALEPQRRDSALVLGKAQQSLQRGEAVIGGRRTDLAGDQSTGVQDPLGGKVAQGQEPAQGLFPSSAVAVVFFKGIERDLTTLRDDV